MLGCARDDIVNDHSAPLAILEEAHGVHANACLGVKKDMLHKVGSCAQLWQVAREVRVHTKSLAAAERENSDARGQLAWD